MPIRWIDATDLAQWAERRDGQDTMPELLSRLIRATTGRASLRFPSQDSVQQPGWDGICEVPGSSQYQYIPAGCSVWEIGTQRDRIATKADEDYEKRSSDPRGIEREKASFVFVTPRRWARKDNWAKRRRDERTWTHVRAYDADDLVHWIELYPAVGHWLAVKIGKRPPGLRQLDEAWLEWSLSTKWPMSAELVLAGRDEEAARTLRWLYGEPAVQAVQADSSDEAIAFLHATISQLPAQYQSVYASRALVAANADAARALLRSPSPLVIVLDEADAGVAARLCEQGHHVYLAYGSGARAPDDIERLRRPPSDAFERALVEMGVDQKGAQTYARESARSLAVLRRLIPSVPGAILPQWAQAQHARTLLPALFAGAWEEANEGDHKVLERLSGESYESYLGKLTPWVGVSDSPLRRSAGAWKIASPRDAWFRVATQITSGDLDRFAATVRDVLSAPDPRFVLDSEKRWMAGLYGQRPVHSELLRHGLAETVVLLSVFDKQVTNVAHAAAYSERVVRKLLENADSQRWWSLSRELRTLAEAAPAVFLDAVDQSLMESESPVMALFKEDGGLFGGAHHSNLLWALEMLAWDSRYLAQVAHLLATLTRLDPGGKYANRPSRSLRHIFLLWLPQTYAPLEQRLKVIDQLRRDESDVAWDLMLGVLPTGHDAADNSPTPRWRDFAPKSPPEVVTYALIHKGAEAIAERVIADVGLNARRWSNLFDRLNDLGPTWRAKAIDQLDRVVRELTDGMARTEIWHALRKLLHHHREYPDAGWSLPAQDLQRLELIYERLQPGDSVEDVSWMFSAHRVQLPKPTGQGWQADEEASNKVRQEAIAELLKKHGVERLFDLTAAVQYPEYVGVAFVDACRDANSTDDIVVRSLLSDEPVRQKFAHGAVVRSREIYGEGWGQTLVERGRADGWKSDVFARAFRALPASKKYWQLLETIGPEASTSYWMSVNPWLRGTNEETIYAARKLLENKRARRALDLVGHEPANVPTDLLIAILRASAREPGPLDGNEATMFQYYVGQILQRLDESSEVSEEEIARLEWLYFPVLEHSRRPPTVLHKTMSSNPQFFLTVLSAVYRPSPESGIKEEDPTDLNRTRAIAAQSFDLLHSWATVPGEANGVVNEQVVKAWIKETRQACKQAGREAIADQQIGRMLAHAPTGKDGAWPAVAIREVIELCKSRDLELGIDMGCTSKRGVTSRAPLDGGKEERGLAKQYREWSRFTEVEWPRTSAMLERIARGFEEAAKRHDDDAERTDWSF